MSYSILENLHPRCSISSCEDASSQESLATLKSYSSIEVPEEYVDIVSHATDMEISVDGDFHLRIWGPDRVIEMMEAYDVSSYFQNCLAIGDDEGGQAIIYMKGDRGFGLYKSGFGDLDPEDAVWVSKSLVSLLVEGNGLDNIPS